MSSEPPPFQESNRCDVCNCSFNTFRRRHHCRCCGRTLCYEHSSNHMPLPQFGIHSSVRVCSDCYNNSSRSRNNDAVSGVDRVDLVTESVSKLDIEDDDGEVKNDETLLQQSNATDLECKCGMPLCICVTSVPEPTPTQIQSTPQASAISKPKRADDIPRNKRANQDIRQNSGLGPSASGVVKPPSGYEVNGEGLREAIKNGDIPAVEELLDKGVDSNYCDKQGLSLLHLAALFNQTDIVFALMDRGAKLDSKNSQGETPLDCAPVMLQFKMRKKMEDALS
ncbi:hypothetical protein Droror1_Dr00005743 [Drosera rotundifolia]